MTTIVDLMTHAESLVTVEELAALALATRARERLIAQWRERGLRSCPEIPQPPEGWSAVDSCSRPLGAALLECADELAALSAATGATP